MIFSCTIEFRINKTRIGKVTEKSSFDSLISMNGIALHKHMGGELVLKV